VNGKVRAMHFDLFERCASQGETQGLFQRTPYLKMFSGRRYSLPRFFREVELAFRASRLHATNDSERTGST
jgi:hypothetical protein